MFVPVPLIASQMSAYSPRRSSPLTPSRTTNVSPPNRRFALFWSAEGERLRSPGQLVGRRGIEPPPPDLARQNFAAERDAALLLFLLDPLADLLTRPTCLHVRQPVARGLGLR